MSDEETIVREAIEEGDMSAGIARVIAGWWHGGQWSALYSFASSGRIGSELLSEIDHELSDHGPAGTDAFDRAALQALRDWIAQPIVSVWSSFGHRFIGADESHTCLTCGAPYHLLPIGDDPTSGAYQTWSGDAPTACTGDTAMTHGINSDCDACSTDVDSSECEHCNHDCNCLMCTG